MLGEAWRALATDPTRALALVETAPAAGVLAEEREALRILALAALARGAEARTAADQFLARYPTSFHRARIERATQEIP